MYEIQYFLFTIFTKDNYICNEIFTIFIFFLFIKSESIFRHNEKFVEGKHYGDYVSFKNIYQSEFFLNCKHSSVQLNCFWINYFESLYNFIVALQGRTSTREISPVNTENDLRACSNWNACLRERVVKYRDSLPVIKVVVNTVFSVSVRFKQAEGRAARRSE